MIVTPRFVFLHLHKSGGTFVNAGLMTHVAGARQIGYHLPRSSIPAPFAALPMLGLVRNPWSYYVSWYSFQRSRPKPNALFHIMSDGGRLDFKATLRNLLSLGHDDALLNRVVAALPAGYSNQGLNLPGFALEPIRGSGLGFYSFLYRYMYGPDVEAVRLGTMERLRTELPRMLEEVGQPVDSALREYIDNAPALNSSQHGGLAEYYDSELMMLIAERDRLVIERHAYVFAGD
ncbi:MAG: hypothetical protein ABW171_00435 [Steroidobacter sp.]